ALPSGTPTRVRTLLEQCLEKEPSRRPRSMHAIRLELEEALGAHGVPGSREDRSAAVPHNLPAPATRFIGRERLVADCVRIQEAPKLLAVVGMGGAGKSRLALRVAETRLEAFPDGVWLIDVAPLAEPDRLVESLAAALALPGEEGSTLLQTVTRWLTSR